MSDAKGPDWRLPSELSMSVIIPSRLLHCFLSGSDRCEAMGHMAEVSSGGMAVLWAGNALGMHASCLVAGNALAVALLAKMATVGASWVTVDDAVCPRLLSCPFSTA